jgi:hypothetical protein
MIAIATMKEGCIALSCFECHRKLRRRPRNKTTRQRPIRKKMKMNIRKGAAGNREDAIERAGLTFI